MRAVPARACTAQQQALAGGVDTSGARQPSCACLHLGCLRLPCHTDLSQGRTVHCAGKSAARVQKGLRPNGAHRWHSYVKNPRRVRGACCGEGEAWGVQTLAGVQCESGYLRVGRWGWGGGGAGLVPAPVLSCEQAQQSLPTTCTYIWLSIRGQSVYQGGGGGRCVCPRCHPWPFHRPAWSPLR